MKKPVIEFKDFTFQYFAQAEPTLYDINLTIYEGESQVGAVMEALVEGPVSETLQPILPEGFSVLSARMEGNTCYLNLPQTSVDLMPQDAAAQRQMVTGMVRSLCSIRDVRQVQILVEGERRAHLGAVDISQPLNAMS